jgi:flagellar biosynthesis protein FliQ
MKTGCGINHKLQNTTQIQQNIKTHIPNIINVSPTIRVLQKYTTVMVNSYIYNR